jgi:hypothetical protein
VSARTWTATDPAPKDWPVVVGPDGVTYGRDEDAAQNEDISGLYVRQQLKHYPGGGVVYGSGLEFSEIFDDYDDGATLREATSDEEATWVETWLSERAS